MSDNGKGSERRGWDKKSREAYEAGYDRIFGRKNRRSRERRTRKQAK